MQYSLVVLFDYIAISAALMCFNGTLESSTLFEASLVSEEECHPGVQNCIRTQQQADGVTLTLRGCDNLFLCQGEGCTSNPVDTCCCNTDWCNSASTTRYQMIASLSLFLTLSLTGYLILR